MASPDWATRGRSCEQTRLVRPVKHGLAQTRTSSSAIPPARSSATRARSLFFSYPGPALREPWINFTPPARGARVYLGSQGRPRTFLRAAHGNVARHGRYTAGRTPARTETGRGPRNSTDLPAGVLVSICRVRQSCWARSTSQHRLLSGPRGKRAGRRKDLPWPRFPLIPAVIHLPVPAPACGRPWPPLKSGDNVFDEYQPSIASKTGWPPCWAKRRPSSYPPERCPT